MRSLGCSVPQSSLLTPSALLPVFTSHNVPKLWFPLKTSKWPTLSPGSILFLKFFDYLWGGEGRGLLSKGISLLPSCLSGSGFPSPYCPNQSRWPALRGRATTIALNWCLVFSQIHVMNAADAVRYKSLILLQNILFLKEKLIA